MPVGIAELLRKTARLAGERAESFDVNLVSAGKLKDIVGAGGMVVRCAASISKTSSSEGFLARRASGIIVAAKDRADALAAGFSAGVSRPFAPEDLVALVERGRRLRSKSIDEGRRTLAPRPTA